MANSIGKSVGQITENRVCTDLAVKSTLDLLKSLESNTAVLSVMIGREMQNIHVFIFAGLVLSMVNASLAKNMSEQSNGALSLTEAHEIIAGFGNMIDMDKLMKMHEEDD